VPGIVAESLVFHICKVSAQSIPFFVTPVNPISPGVEKGVDVHSRRMACLMAPGGADRAFRKKSIEVARQVRPLNAHFVGTTFPSLAWRGGTN